MGNHVAEVVGLPSIQTFKVHGQMCSELLKLVIRISKIFPELEDARPRCSSGITALCELNDGVEKANSRLQSCSESSVLYLALTGDALLSRCKKYRSLFDQNLSHIMTMVPVMLAGKISGIISEIRITEFCLDPSEAEAGKVLRDLLHRSSNTNDFGMEAVLAAFCNASSLLRIVSQKALLIERRSIKKMLANFEERESRKREILLFFLDLLKKCGKSMPLEQKVNGSTDLEHPVQFPSPYRLPGEVDLRVNYRPNEGQIGMLSRPVPPEQFLCPLSLKLMYDPVVIASGLTYERMWIQKYFEEGNITCPKTNRELDNLSITSNIGMKDLIGKWCAEHGISVPNPEIQETLTNSWETSSNSIASMTSSMYHLNLPVDFSNVSLGSCQESDVSNTEISRKDMELLSKFGELPWDCQCNAVEDVKKLLKHSNGSRYAFPSGKMAQLIFRFLEDARDVHDVEAQMTGFVLLLEFMQENRDNVLCIKEDAYDLLASFLDTDLSKEALSVLEVLSSQRECCHNVASSDAVTGVQNILDSEIPELLEPALHILSNLSSMGSLSLPSNILPKLATLSDDQTLARHCITILKNMCNNEKGKISIAESEGCIASIVKALETDDLDTQEQALSILLPLCAQRDEYCELVMHEGIFTNLLSISLNGNNGAKAAAKELLRILRDVIESTGESCCNADATVDSNLPNLSNSTIPSKPFSFFGKVFGKKKK